MSGSLMGMHQIAVNTTTLADGSTIAAYLTSASGTLLTNTTIGGKQYLDAKGASEYAEDTAHVSGDFLTGIAGVRNDAGTSFGADGDYIPLSLTAAGALRVDATVNFAGDYAEDSPHVSGDVGLFQLGVRRDTRSSMVDTDGDYTGWQATANGDMRVRDDDANTTLTSLLTEIQNLSHAEDVAHVSGDMGIQSLAVRKDAQGTNTSADGDYASLLTWSEGSLKTVDIANSTILQQQVSVSSTAAQVPAANLANRKVLMLQNTSAARIWIGSATVTTSGATAGIELPSNAFMELEVGPAVNVYAVKSGIGTLNLNVLELS